MGAGLALHALGALAAIAALLAGLRYLATWPGALALSRAKGRRRLLRIVDSAALPSASSLHVVAVADRYFAIGRSAASLVLLCELSGEEIALHARSDRG